MCNNKLIHRLQERDNEVKSLWRNCSNFKSCTIKKKFVSSTLANYETLGPTKGGVRSYFSYLSYSSSALSKWHFCKHKEGQIRCTYTLENAYSLVDNHSSEMRCLCSTYVLAKYFKICIRKPKYFFFHLSFCATLLFHLWMPWSMLT